MAKRTTDTAVREIIDNCADISMVPFISMANSLTNWLDGLDEGVLNTATLADIEKNLAAHFYTMRDPLYTSKSTGRASGSFQGRTGMVLSATFYGQTAMLLDTTGLLAQRSKEVENGGRTRARLTWAGSSTDSARPDDVLSEGG